jgi:hypothetical protein
MSGSTQLIAVLWTYPEDSPHAGARFWGCHSTNNDGRLADWPHPPLRLIALGAAVVNVVEGEGLELIEAAKAARGNGQTENKEP